MGIISSGIVLRTSESCSTFCGVNKLEEEFILCVFIDGIETAFLADEGKRVDLDNARLCIRKTESVCLSGGQRKKKQQRPPCHERSSESQKNTHSRVRLLLAWSVCDEVSQR